MEKKVNRFQKFIFQNYKKILIFIIILIVIILVVVDLSSTNCIFRESNELTKMRLMCSGLNSTDITNTTCMNQEILVNNNDDLIIYQLNTDKIDDPFCYKSSSCLEAGVNELVRFSRSSIENAILGIVIYICVYIVATVAFIPGSILTISAGVGKLLKYKNYCLIIINLYILINLLINYHW